MGKADADFHAWNPGLSSDIPPALMPRVTLYDPANSTVSYADARSAAEFCGLKPQEMVAFTPQRLAVHEVLIRVTADLYVPDGPNYEDLGISLRGMTRRILEGYVYPKLEEIEAAFAEFREEAERRICAILDRDIYARPLPEVPDGRGFVARLLGKRPPAPAPQSSPEFLAMPEWQAAAAKTEDALERACLESLHTIVAGIVRRSGRLIGDRELIVRLALNQVNNSYGSRRISELIAPIFREAAGAEGYRFLPFQKAPFVLNVKGASAAGKSTLRSHQRRLAERLDLTWEDFALISPDYWRKFLIDYDSLGEDFKYAAMLTGQELEIIDKKLDRYMEAKATRSEMPHLLIDRFRFDSFEALSSQPADGRLLSRFGDTVFMFFIITPPAETVERAWKRGIETGRYKAVDDLLYHNIEAYTGMPQLFLNWVKKERQTVHFEFLDNSVPYGERPRTIAFGWNDKLTVLDTEAMRRLTLYQKVNVAAQGPDEVLLEEEAAGGGLLEDCIEKIGSVTFVDPSSLEVQAETRAGRCEFERDGFFAAHALKCTRSGAASGEAPEFDAEREQKFTVGSWGAAG